MLEKILLIFLVFLAFIAINTSMLRKSVIYLGIFSLIASFLFLIYNAPDVAIAEAIMAAALTTVLYLVSIKKHKTITIYYISDDPLNDQFITKNTKPQILKDIESQLLEKELEPQVIISSEKTTTILSNGNFDFLVYNKKKYIFIYGHIKDIHLKSLISKFGQSICDEKKVKFVLYENTYTPTSKIIEGGLDLWENIFYYFLWF